MQQRKDYYKILGVQKNASDDEIKKAFRKKAMECHPDKNKDACSDDKIKELNEAYSVLSNPKKKASYDLGEHQSPFQGPFGNGKWSDFFGMNDVFSWTQNSRRQQKRQSRGENGADLRFTIELTLQELLTDSKKTIKYKRYDKCETCSGRGSTLDDEIECDTCHGTGRIVYTNNMQNFQIRQEQECRKCNGSGRTFKEKCKICNGDGRVIKEEIVQIDIPAGVTENDELTMRYKGHYGLNNGLPGHLRIRFKEKQDNYFKRECDNITCNVFITISQAVLGDSINVRTLKGELKVVVPSGVSNGQFIVLQGQGLPNIKTKKIGDQIVYLNINIPKQIDADQKQLFEQLKKMGL